MFLTTKMKKADMKDKVRYAKNYIAIHFSIKLHEYSSVSFSILDH